MTFESPRRRKHRFLPWLAAGLVLGGAAAFLLKSFPGGSPDYRDPVQLSAAVKQAEQAKGVSVDGADCARLTGGTYLCAVASSGGAMGSYRVTVSPDGRSWKFS
jgi:hypothetical protein